MQHTFSDYNLKLLKIQILHIIRFFQHTSKLQTAHIFWSLLATGFYNGMHLGAPRRGATLLPTCCQAHIIQIPCSVPPMRCRLKLRNNYGKIAPSISCRKKKPCKIAEVNYQKCLWNELCKAIFERREVFNLTSTTPDLKSRSFGLISAIAKLPRVEPSELPWSRCNNTSVQIHLKFEIKLPSCWYIYNLTRMCHNTSHATRSMNQVLPWRSLWWPFAT